MHTHPNARLAPLGRERLLHRHIDHGKSLAFLATQVEISVRSAYRSKPWREACSAPSLISKRTRPDSPQTNGKAERFIKTLLAEWAFWMAFQASTEQNRWLPRYLAIYNGRRCHVALAGRTPFQQLGLLRATNDLVRKHS